MKRNNISTHQEQLYRFVLISTDDNQHTLFVGMNIHTYKL